MQDTQNPLHGESRHDKRFEAYAVTVGSNHLQRVTPPYERVTQLSGQTGCCHDFTFGHSPEAAAQLRWYCATMQWQAST